MKRVLMSMLLGMTVLTIAAGDLVWETDLKAAKARAEKEGKTILMNFTGSDWCGWCIRLDREVFSTSTFKEYADENLVLLKVDFPRRKQLPREQQKANHDLSVRYGVNGFPTILLVDTKGSVKLRTGYQYGGAGDYVAHLKSAVN